MAVAINPSCYFLVDNVGAFADSEGAAITAGAFRVLIEQGSEAELSQRAFDQAMLAALEIDAGKLPAVERAHERVTGRVKIIFEVEKARGQSPGLGKSKSGSPKMRRCDSLVLQRLSQAGESAHAFVTPSQPRLRLHASHAMLELVEAGQQRNMRRQTPRARRDRILEPHALLRQAIKIRVVGRA